MHLALTINSVSVVVVQAVFVTWSSTSESLYLAIMSCHQPKTC
jgi:hypothetical protein